MAVWSCVLSDFQIEIENEVMDRTLNFETIFEIERCCEFVSRNKFTKVCDFSPRSSTDQTQVSLQVPDNMLSDSVKLYEILSRRAPETSFFILADTTYFGYAGGRACASRCAAAA
jgi:hypothetical protein